LRFFGGHDPGVCALGVHSLGLALRGAVRDKPAMRLYGERNIVMIAYSPFFP
jgi:hypothetical protein